ncbi:MAG: TVP38/TMEM64 family protein [Pseudomonadota bacterium]|jgi:uncharacterized membrane protein YdjX (TVP38/TMEM64 family)
MVDMNRQHRPGPSLLGAILASTLFVALILAVLVYFDLDEEVLRLLHWMDAQGWWAPLLFILVMALVVVLLLPGAPLTIGAGFVFGLAGGTLCVVVGTTLGAALAFLIARRLFGERAARYVLQHPKLRLVSNELVPHGWKIVMLSRMVPFFPFKLSNYFFGLTSVSLRGFVGGTFLGVIPFSLHNVYLGAIAAEVATLGARAEDPGIGAWLLYGAGFLLVLGGVVHFSRMAWRALAQYAEE